MPKVTDVVAELAKPIAERAGCTLWDVEYVKEAGEWFLRVYIDRVLVLYSASNFSTDNNLFKMAY